MIIITFKYRYRKQIIIGIFIFLLIGGIISFAIINNLNKKPAKEEIILDNLPKKKKTKNKIIKEFKVDIKGEVLTPGIYSLKNNSRVMDVINMAGGLTNQADTSVINLSKKITDEMVIIIYSRQQVKEFEKTKEQESIVQGKCIKSSENALKNDACIEESSKDESPTNKKISINTATKEELMTLPGIGESKAEDIIKYRENTSKFSKIDDIKNVSGIGDSLFAKIKESITT